MGVGTEVGVGDDVGVGLGVGVKTGVVKEVGVDEPQAPAKRRSAAAAVVPAMGSNHIRPSLNPPECAWGLASPSHP